MAPGYTNDELVDMLLIYGEARQNASGAARLYREKFPNRRQPHSASFIALVLRLRGTGDIKPHRGRGGGATKSHRTLKAEEEMLKMIEDDDRTLSTRFIARQIRISRSTVWRTLREAQLDPRETQKEQALTSENQTARVQFCEWFVKQCELNIDFAPNILTTDESSFTSTEIYDFQNVWSGNTQLRFTVNVWAGILNGMVIGPLILPAQLTPKWYLHFLANKLPELLENVPLNVRRDMWFLHDGTSPHFERKVRQYLRDLFQKRRITRKGHVQWPARSPDLNPVNFYLWERMKQLVYGEGEVNNELEMQERIKTAAAKLRQENTGLCYESWLRR
ncbi:hypothetical protein Trydic_g1110, partial [Trypoxylus dichotomus]